MGIVLEAIGTPAPTKVKEYLEYLQQEPEDVPVIIGH